MDAEDGRELLAEDGLKTQEMNGPQLRRSSRPRVANRRVMAPNGPRHEAKRYTYRELGEGGHRRLARV